MTEKTESWFIERIGKRIYRGPVNCNCPMCKKVTTHGLLINDERHADYLYMVHCLEKIDYFDEPVKCIKNE